MATSLHGKYKVNSEVIRSKLKTSRRYFRTTDPGFVDTLIRSEVYSTKVAYLVSGKVGTSLGSILLRGQDEIFRSLCLTERELVSS